MNYILFCSNLLTKIHTIFFHQLSFCALFTERIKYRPLNRITIFHGDLSYILVSIIIKLNNFCMWFSVQRSGHFIYNILIIHIVLYGTRWCVWSVCVILCDGILPMVGLESVRAGNCLAFFMLMNYHVLLNKVLLCIHLHWVLNNPCFE